MKKYIIGLIKRILITILIIMLPIVIIEQIIKNFDINVNWVREDRIITLMDFDKLKYSYPGECGLWLHKNETLKPKEDGVKRIFIVGDSYIFGHGYSNLNHIWWKQFAHILKEEGYENVEVIAAGASGYSTEDELEFILKDKELMSLVDPDFIVIGYVTNDPDVGIHSYDEVISQEDFDKNGVIPGIEIFKSVFPNVYCKISSTIFDKNYLVPEFEETFGISYTTWLERINQGESLLYYENNVIKPLIKYIDEELQIPFLYYMTVYDEEDPNIRNIENMFRRNNIETYFSSDEIANRNIQFHHNNLKINPANWHPSVECAKAYATCLLQIFEENHKEILGEKTGVYEPKFCINDWMPYSLIPERIDDNSYYITYPKKGEKLSFLTLPVKKEYVKLNLEDPLNISNISIEGENVEEITIWINTINEELGFDDQVMIDMGKKKEKFVWEIDESLKVTSININAKVKNKEACKLKITVK